MIGLYHIALNRCTVCTGKMLRADDFWHCHLMVIFYQCHPTIWWIDNVTHWTTLKVHCTAVFTQFGTDDNQSKALLARNMIVIVKVGIDKLLLTLALKRSYLRLFSAITVDNKGMYICLGMCDSSATRQNKWMNAECSKQSCEVARQLFAPGYP